jgi:hypothetical protein
VAASLPSYVTLSRRNLLRLAAAGLVAGGLTPDGDGGQAESADPRLRHTKLLLVGAPDVRLLAGPGRRVQWQT